MECKSKTLESPLGGLYAYRTIKLHALPAIPPILSSTDFLTFFMNLPKEGCSNAADYSGALLDWAIVFSFELRMPVKTQFFQSSLQPTPRMYLR